MKWLVGAAAAVAFVATASGEETRLSERQASEIGKLLLSTKHYEKHKENFSCEKPVFDPKSKVWRLPWTGKSGIFCGAPIPFCEIRDSDSHIRIGSISSSGFRPRSAGDFKMPVSLRRRIAKISELP